jgi:hypothetical protein
VREVLPAAFVVALLVNPANPTYRPDPEAANMQDLLEGAARTLRPRIFRVTVIHVTLARHKLGKGCVVRGLGSLQSHDARVPAGALTLPPRAPAAPLMAPFRWGFVLSKRTTSRG